MRVLVIAAVLASTTAHVQACPPLDACLVRLPSTIRSAVASSPPRAVPPSAAVSVDPVALAVRVYSAPKRAPGEIEMPWIWRVLREEVYSRMPTYEQRNELKLVLAPVIVTSPVDTVPGLGIAGDF